MTKIRVFQAKEEHVDEVKRIIMTEEQNPSDELLHTMYVCVLETEETSLSDAFMDEDILLTSVEAMVNASGQRLRKMGPCDVVEVANKGKKLQILLLENDEYEIIEE